MYDEVDMNESYKYGIYVNDDKKTWYDENTRKHVPPVIPIAHIEGTQLAQVQTPVHIPIQQHTEKMTHPIREKLITSDDQTYFDKSIMYFVILLCVAYFVHIISGMNTKMDNILMMQHIMLHSTNHKV